MAEVPQTPEELAAFVHEVRGSIAAGADARTGMDSKLETLEKGLRAVQLGAAEARISSSDSDISVREYTAVSDHEVKDAQTYYRGQDARYLATEAGTIRLLNHEQASGAFDWGLLDDPKPRSEWQKRLQEEVTNRNLVRQMLKPDGRGRVDSPISDRKVLRLLQMGPAPVRKIFADASTIGAEWLPERTLADLERSIELSDRIGGLFDTVQVPARTGSLVVPFLSTGLRPFLKKKATADDPGQYPSSTMATADRTYDVVSFAVRQQIDEDASEDSIIDVLALGRQELVDAIVDGRDDTIINGDTADPHQDALATWDIRSHWGSTGLGTAADHRRGYIGLRARAFDIANATDQNAAQTVEGAAAARAKLNAAAAMGDTIYVVSPEYFLSQMLTFTGFLTWDAVGPNATVLTGQLGEASGPLPGQVGFLFGVPVIVNWFMSADLAASGLFTGAGSQTSMLVLNRSRFRRFVKRGAMMEMDKDITRGVINSVITTRDLFDTVDKGTSVKNVHLSYNLDSA